MDQLSKNLQYFADSDLTADRVRAEVDRGLELVQGVNQRMVTVFGSSKLRATDPDYQHAKKVAGELGKLGYAIITGGGPGIMQAAAEGALASGAESIGMQGSLIPNEHVPATLFTKRFGFDFIFVRRFVMAIKSDAMIFYPGGYGTLNELMEYLVLEQLDMIDRVPLILVNSAFWRGMNEWFRDVLVAKGTLSPQSLSLLHVVDAESEVIRHVRGEE